MKTHRAFYTCAALWWQRFQLLILSSRRSSLWRKRCRDRSLPRITNSDWLGRKLHTLRIKFTERGDLLETYLRVRTFILCPYNTHFLTFCCIPYFLYGVMYTGYVICVTKLFEAITLLSYISEMSTSHVPPGTPNILIVRIALRTGHDCCLRHPFQFLFHLWHHIRRYLARYTLSVFE
jgi:hypothetical protein